MLDKKALRKFANDKPAPAIPAGHGLLYVDQVDYIIRTDIRNIEHRRTLVLYIYDRKQAVAGNAVPLWTMFHAAGSYITLVRKPDGASRWREAAFERLGKDYRFTGKCAFYSARDERRICDFFHDDEHGGIIALTRAQKAILDSRARKRQLAKERNILRRMEPLKALPRGLKAWIRHDIMPAYFRCEHASSRKSVTGVCTSCGKESTLPRAAHGSKIACPHCKRELTVQSAGKAGRRYDRDTVQVVEKAGSDEVVIRIVKAYYNYDRDGLMPRESVYENARIFVRQDADGRIRTEPYHFSYSKGTLTHWVAGVRPVFSYCANFESETYGHVYCRSLPEALSGTPWQYCPLVQFYGHFRGPMQVAPFLKAYIEHPRLEHLVKTGFYDLASDLAYGRVRDTLLDETKKRTHRILRVDAEDVGFLRGLNADAGILRTFQKYESVKDRQRLLKWQLENDVARDVTRCLEYVTAHKFMRYADRQYSVLRERKTGYGGPRYQDMQSVVSEYRDYLEMCAKLGYDMRNTFVLFPKDLQAAHDRVQRRIKIRNNERAREDFNAAMKSISRHLDFELDGMKIVMPSSPDELAAEGNALHHCVGGYVDRIARKECIILFLRRCEDVSKPFYTVEVRDRKAVQVRGMQNADMTPEVRNFIGRWERQVLMAAA